MFSNIKKIEGIREVERRQNVDSLVKANNKEYVVKFANIINNMNNLEIIDGTMPKTSSEGVVEKSFEYKTGYSIGEKLI